MISHCNPVRHEITLVDYQDNLFVCFLLFDKFEYRLAYCSQWVSRIQDVENNIG